MNRSLLDPISVEISVINCPLLTSLPSDLLIIHHNLTSSSTKRNNIEQASAYGLRCRSNQDLASAVVLQAVLALCDRLTHSSIPATLSTSSVTPPHFYTLTPPVATFRHSFASSPLLLSFVTSIANTKGITCLCGKTLSCTATVIPSSIKGTAGIGWSKLYLSIL